jgi:hypothetical protein
MRSQKCLNGKVGCSLTEPHRHAVSWPAPDVFWRCEACGRHFDTARSSHSRTEHARNCTGYKCGPDCPTEIECGPVVEVTGRT